MSPRYITEKEVSNLTGRALQTLRNDRSKGQGFAYRKFGRQVRYREDEVIEAMEARKIEPRPL